MSDLMRTELLANYPLEGQVMVRREDYAFRKALELYYKVHTSAYLSELWAKLTGHPNRLIAIPEVYELINCLDLGHQTVEIYKIKGSEGRNKEYDSNFRPLNRNHKERWVRMAVLVILGATLPPVELIQMDKVFFVRDGHSRISVMRALGCKYVDAHILHLETSFCLEAKSRLICAPVSEFVIVDL